MKAQFFGLLAITGLVHVASAGVTSTFAVSGWKQWNAPISSTTNGTIPSYPASHPPTTTKEHPKPTTTTTDCEYEDDEEDYCPTETHPAPPAETHPAPPAETHPSPPAETHPSPPAETHPPPAETHPTTTYAPPAETHLTTTYAPPAQTTTTYTPPTYTGAAEKNKMAGAMLAVPALAMLML